MYYEYAAPKRRPTKESIVAKKNAKKSTENTAPRKREASKEAFIKFARAWNAAKTREEALANCGVSEGKAVVWATKLRKLDIDLQKFPRGVGPTLSKEDIAEIQKAAKAGAKAA